MSAARSSLEKPLEWMPKSFFYSLKYMKKGIIIVMVIITLVCAFLTTRYFMHQHETIVRAEKEVRSILTARSIQLERGWKTPERAYSALQKTNNALPFIEETEQTTYITSNHAVISFLETTNKIPQRTNIHFERHGASWYLKSY